MSAYSPTADKIYGDARTTLATYLQTKGFILGIPVLPTTVSIYPNDPKAMVFTRVEPDGNMTAISLCDDTGTYGALKLAGCSWSIGAEEHHWLWQEPKFGALDTRVKNLDAELLAWWKNYVADHPSEFADKLPKSRLTLN
jgi:hypothetical protein